MDFTLSGCVLKLLHRFAFVTAARRKARETAISVTPCMELVWYVLGICFDLRVCTWAAIHRFVTRLGSQWRKVSGTGTHAFIISLNLSVINKWHQLSKLIVANQIEPNVNRNHVLPRDVNERRRGRWARAMWAWEIIIKSDVCGN